MRFDSEFVEPVLNGEKTATLRLDLASDAFPVGKQFHLATPDGTPFASAVVDERGYTSVEMAAKMTIEGHQSYETTDALMEQLRGYYPDETIDPNTRVEIIEWEADTLRETESDYDC